MMHGHFLSKAGVIWSPTVERPLDNQTVQYKVSPRKPASTLLHLSRCLHANNEEEITKIEILGRISVPFVTVGIVDACHQHLGSGIRNGSHTRGIMCTDVGIAGGRGDRTIVVRSGNEVVITDIM